MELILSPGTLSSTSSYVRYGAFVCASYPDGIVTSPALAFKLAIITIIATSCMVKDHEMVPFQTADRSMMRIKSRMARMPIGTRGTIVSRLMCPSRSNSSMVPRRCDQSALLSSKEPYRNAKYSLRSFTPYFTVSQRTTWRPSIDLAAWHQVVTNCWSSWTVGSRLRLIECQLQARFEKYF